MEVFLVIMTILSAATAAYSQYQQGKEQEEAREYNALVGENQAQWAEYNAKREADVARQQVEYAEYNAAVATTEAEEEAQKKGEEGRRLIAAQKAKYGKAGILLEGTPIDVLAQTMLEVNYDRLGILRRGETEAYNWKYKAWQYQTGADTAMREGASTSDVLRSGAALNRMQGAQAGRAGTYQAGTTILTGASKVADVYNKSKKKQDQSLLTGF